MTSHDDIRAALEAATPGPWQYECGDNGPDEWADMPDVLIAGRGLGDGMNDADARLIGHAPEWLAELLAEVDALTARAEAAEQAIQLVRELHTPEVAYDSEHHDCEPSECDRAGEGKPYERCAHCSGFAWEQLWPCSTISALDGGEK